MKKQALIYGLFALALVGSAGLTEIETSNVVTDAVTVSSSQTMDDERNEKREEGYEAQESVAEYNER